MGPLAPLEHRLAIMTNWAFLAGFGICFVLSGFSQANPATGLGGFALFVAGFIAHVIINRIFGVDFSSPQVALGLITFVVGVLCFLASCIFDPSFGETDVYVGLIGFSAIMACFIVYVMINYGVRGSYAMIQRLQTHGRSSS